MSANAIDPNETTATRRQRGERIAAQLSGDPNPALLETLDRDFPFLANALTTIPAGFPRAIQASRAVADLLASRQTA